MYPGTDTLRNNYGITDDKELGQQERFATRARGNEVARISFPLTADGYRSLHKHLFQDVYEWAGKDRTVDIAKGGARFAHAAYVSNSLDAVFRDLNGKDNLRALSREEFFDRLGNHINELNAVHPFRDGNGRTMRHHAEQIAREAGHPIRTASIDQAAWMDASRHGFLTGDHRGLTAALAAAAVRRDLAPEARIGPAGVAQLPPRAPPDGMRYRLPLTKAREELERYLPVARQQAAERVNALTRDDAPMKRIEDARTELAYLRHAKGPVYQSHLLTYLGVRHVEAVIHKDQTPIERVREVGAAIGVQINSQNQAQLQRAVRSLERPVLPPGHAPGQERLAAQFLKNSPEKNNADPRLAPAQAIVDDAMRIARERGDSGRAVTAVGESTRQLVAGRIKTGEALDGEIARQSPRSTPDPDRGRGR